MVFVLPSVILCNRIEKLVTTWRRFKRKKSGLRDEVSLNVRAFWICACVGRCPVNEVFFCTFFHTSTLMYAGSSMRLVLDRDEIGVTECCVTHCNNMNWIGGWKDVGRVDE